MRALAWLAAVLALSATLPALADATREEAALERSWGAIGTVIPGDLEFVTSDGGRVSLDAFRGRPLLVSLVYTGCTDVCPAIIESLHPAVEIGQDALGEDSFASVTVGFDTRNDTPERMRSFARARGIALPNWQFLSGDAATIDRLSEAVGFTIEPSSGGFDHMAQVTILDEAGRIYRHVYGGVFEPPAIVEPLKELVFGRQRPVTTIDGLIDRVRLFCTIYSPGTGRYYFNYSMFIGLAIGAFSLLAVLAWLIREFRRTGAQA